MSRLDISSVRQIPLDPDDDVFETWEMDGCRDVIRDAPFEQNPSGNNETANDRILEDINRLAALDKITLPPF